MAETALTTAVDRPSYQTADGRFDEDRVREFVEAYDGRKTRTTRAASPSR